MARSVVGLDVGSAAVRAVEVRVTRRGPVVHRHGRVALPSGAVEAGLVRDESAVADALRQLWAQEKFSTRSVHLGIGTASVLVRQLELDWMPDPDLRRSLRFQVADLLPVPVDDANLDHLLLGEGERLDDEGHRRRTARILLVAAARDAADGLVRCAHRARLRPLSADLAAFATVRTATAGLEAPAAPGDAEAVVDIGADKVTVVVHVGGRPTFVRVAPGSAGSMLTRTLVEQTGCGWDRAEELKRTPGTLPPVGVPARSQEEAVLLEAATRSVAEIRTTLEFHASSDPLSALRRVVLTGRGSLLPGLVGHCEAALGLPVRLLADDPATDGLDADLSVPFGLCLGRAA